VEDVESRIHAFDRVMSSATQQGLWANQPLSIMWDDHDWLGNNAGGDTSQIGYQAALESYRMALPYYEPLPSSFNNVSETSDGYGTRGMYQAFTIGTVRFILTDLRSESSQTSIYSPQQRDWLFRELENSTSYDFVVWMSTVPWIGSSEEGGDSWKSYAKDRAELSGHIQKVVTKKNLLAIAGDAHMLAFDDGSNTYYVAEEDTDASVQGGSFPILQTGPLDRLGSVKGGPFSDGCHTYLYERNHQYSVIEFHLEDRDQPPCLTIRSYDEKNLVIDKELCGPDIFGNSRNDAGQPTGSCEARYFSTPNIILVCVSGVLLLVAMGLPFFVFEGLCAALGMSFLILFLFALTYAAGFLIPLAAQTNQYDAFETCLVCLLQIFSVVLYLTCWKCYGTKVEKTENR
jgi:hypothetical protein